VFVHVRVSRLACLERRQTRARSDVVETLFGFYLVAPKTFFASVNQTDLLIALDRFSTLVSANKESKRTKSYYNKRIKGILLFSLSVYVSGVFDSFDQTVPLTHCAYRVALRRISSWALWAMSFTVNATTVILYLVLFVKTRMKIKTQVEPTDTNRNNNTVQETLNKLMIILTKV